MVRTSLGNQLTIFLNLAFLSQPLILFYLEMSVRMSSIHFFAVVLHY